MDKTCASAEAAVADIPEGATLMVGGFGLCGNPENLIRALHRKGTKGLTIISNNCGIDGKMGKEVREFGGRLYVLEHALRADYSLVKAHKGDRFGNLVYRKTARNFNAMMATAGRITLAEVEELLAPGTLDPDHVHTPGIFVKRVLQGPAYEKPIEQRTVRKRSS
jgi:3-oxoacid CoA-transferase subunit A